MSSLTLVPQHSVAPSHPAAYRLTRRGRVVVFLAGLALLLGAALFFGAHSVATEEPGSPEPTRIIQVAPGDTLWSIAGDLAGDGEIRGMIQRIQRLNALDSGMVYAGQQLRVPGE